MSTPVVPPTGTVTFLFTDIEGSTKLWEQNPDAMRPALARHDALLRQAIEDNGGFVFKTVGDAFCAAFTTAPDAVQAALAAQIAIVAENWPTETPLRVRMALHTGTTEERNGDYFGQPLNRVARLLSAGHGGQTLTSGATQELTRDHLPPSVTLIDLGERRLKDLGRLEHIFQVIHPSLTADFPSLHSLDNPDLPNNLPQQVTSFIGREKEVAEIKGLLNKTRLLTLTGAGGSGKSRLSLQAAADLLDQYFDGVWLIELAPVSDPALVPHMVADTLGVQEEPGKPITKTLVDFLTRRRLLLIVDNAEHLLAACASLASNLLKNCPDVRILTSSREPLWIAGEQTYRVPTLSLPDATKPQTIESVSQYEAVRLFIERAKLVQPTFAVTDATAPTVAQICWCLDGIPLALELAAARVRSLSVEQMMARLDDRFKLLTSGSRTVLPRQQTLRALIDWSYDLLTESEKMVLRRLSVFVGGWTLPSAEAVCSGDGIEDFEVLDLLTSLVDKSLVVYEEGGGGRYRLLETVRQYGRDRLVEGGEAEAAGGRAAYWFLALAEQAEPLLTGPEQGVWLARLETEHDNLRASLSWYEQWDEQRAEGAEAGLRLSGALMRFWSVRGHYSEGRQWLGTALARTEEGASVWETSAVRAKALNGSGNLAFGQGDFAEARIQYEESLAIWRRLGDQRGIANSLHNLGNVSYRQCDFALARTQYEESLALRRWLGDKGGIANSLTSLGNLAYGQDDYAVARPLYEESLVIQRRLGDQMSIVTLLHNLGLIATRQRDSASASALLEEGLTIQRRLGDQDGIAYTLIGMAGAALGQHQPLRAAHLCGVACSLRKTLGNHLSSEEQDEIDDMAAHVREALGEEAFSAAWNVGKAMTLEQAVEYALSDE